MNIKTLLLCLCAALSGCVTSHVEKPYIKETITTKDGTITTRETSADSITGGTLEMLKRKP